MCAGCTLYLRKVSKNQLENLAQEGYSQLLQRISERMFNCSFGWKGGRALRQKSMASMLDGGWSVFIGISGGAVLVEA